MAKVDRGTPEKGFNLEPGESNARAVRNGSTSDARAAESGPIGNDTTASTRSRSARSVRPTRKAPVRKAAARPARKSGKPARKSATRKR
jgi:hypothetical protein